MFYVEFISQLGFHNYAENIINDLIYNFFEMGGVDELFDNLTCKQACKKFTPLLCELRYNMLNVIFFQSNENLFHNSPFLSIIEQTMQKKKDEIVTLLNYKSIDQFTELDRYKYKNLLNFHKEKSRYCFTIGKYDRSYRAIVINNSIIELLF